MTCPYVNDANGAVEGRRLIFQMLRLRPVADPYPRYNRVREIAPALPLKVPGVVAPMCLVSTYAQCSRIGRDRRLAPLPEHYWDADDAGRQRHPFTHCLYQSMLFRSGATHRARRMVVAKPFAPRKIARRQREIALMVDTLLDRLAARGAGGATVDLEEELALPYSSAVIGRLLGIPETEALRLGRLARRIDPVFELAPPAQQRQQMVEAGNELLHGLLTIARERRRRPHDDLLSDLAAHYGPADEEELARTATLLFVGGLHSPASLVGLGARLFLDHPDQAQAVRDRPKIAGAATDEILRYEPPVQVITRVATGPVDFDGVTAAPGDLVFGLVAAANRDPAYVPDPDRFDVRRPPAPGLSFGSGAHYCLGASVARLQGQVLFPRLLTRFPRMEPAGTPRYRSPGFTLRGFEYLPVRLAPPRRRSLR